MELSVNKKQVTLKEIVSFCVVAQRIENEKMPVKFAYALMKNKSMIMPDVEAVASVERRLIDLEKSRIFHCESRADKDADGKPMMKNGKYVGVDESDKILVEIMNDINNVRKQYNDLLNSSILVSFHVVNSEDLPKEISPANLENLMLMVNDK